MLSSSPRSRAAASRQVGRGYGRTVHPVPPQDRENLSPPRRYMDKCHHSFIFLPAKVPPRSGTDSRSGSESCRSSPGLRQPLQQKLLRLSQRCTGEGKEKKKESKLHFPEISLPNCLRFTTHSGKGERGEKEKKKGKKQRRRNSSVEAISGWEWERVSALMSSLAV